MPYKRTGGTAGVRLNPQQDERTRSAIKSTLLMQRLQSFAMGEGVQMTGDQIRAAVALLAKCLPDMKAIEHKGDGSGPLVVKIVRYSDKGEDKE